MRVALIILAVLVASGTAMAVWWLSVEEPQAPAEVVAAPPPQPVVVAPAEPIELPVAPAAEVPAPAVLEAPHDVRFTVMEGQRKAIGERVTLARGRELVSGQVDVMGEVVLPLTSGEWDVISPRRALEKSLHIEPTTSNLTLTVADAKLLMIAGWVFDERGAPAANATVHILVGGTSSSVGVRADGSFAATVSGSSARLHAESGTHRSRVSVVSGPDAAVKLRIEAPALLSVQVTGAGASTATIIVRDDVSVQCCTGPSGMFRVLKGQVRIAALSVMNGRLVSASADETLEAEFRTVKLRLREAPPLTGKVLDPSGNPVRGVTVVVRPIGTGADDLLEHLSRPAEVAATGPVASGVTADDGSFSIEWPAVATLFSVELSGSWGLATAKYVSPRDEALVLSAQPRP